MPVYSYSEDFEADEDQAAAHVTIAEGLSKAVDAIVAEWNVFSSLRADPPNKKEMFHYFADVAADCLEGVNSKHLRAVYDPESRFRD